MSEKIVFPPNSRERILLTGGAAGRPLRHRDVGMTALAAFTSPYEIQRSSPVWHVVLLTCAGEGASKGPVETERLVPGSLWIGAAGQPQHYWAVRRWSVLWFHILDTPRWAFLRDAPKSPRIFPGGFRALARAMEGFLAESTLPGDDSVRLAESYAEIIGLYLDRILVRDESPALARRKHRLETLWRTVSGNLRHPWSVEELAGELHVSTAQFHRWALEIHGEAPMKIVTRLRMEQARNLLSHTDDTLEQIADRLGYRTAFSFSRAFSRHVGQCPSHFRGATTLCPPSNL